jgi:hypothetical protein
VMWKYGSKNAKLCYLSLSNTLSEPSAGCRRRQINTKASASLQWVIRSISADNHMCVPHKSWVSNTLART